MLSQRKACVLLAIACVVYAAVVVATWGLTYWDFGDGNYLYIASRVNAGVTLYKSIMAPQPPLHVLVGCVSERVGAAFGSALIGVRVWCLIARLAAVWLVFAVALRLARDATAALVAACIYILLPIGFWWSLCYQSENLEIILLLFALWQLTRWTPRAAIYAGIASGLAIHTNMTAAPYFLCNVLFLAFRRPRLLLPYAGVAMGVWGAGALLANSLSDGYYWDNVVANQVGTFPRTEMLSRDRPGYTFWNYAFDKITGQGWKVLKLEGLMIIAAAIGIALRVRETPRTDEHWHTVEFLSWSAIGHWLSICFTAKGGTVNYIFVLGEPMVAIFAAYALLKMLPHTWLRGKLEASEASADERARAFPRLVFSFFAMLISFVPGLSNIGLTLTQRQAELPAREVAAVRDMIRTYAKPGDPILAPPFYAFITDTTVAGELCENYIWQMKYANERFDKVEGFGVRKMQEVALMLERGEIPIVLLDLNQTGRIPEIAASIERNYQPIESKPLQTMNTQLGLYIPKGEQVRHKRLME